MIYKAVELEEGVQVQFLAVYALRWRPEWGEPKIGFIEIDDNLMDAAPDLLKACKKALSYLAARMVAESGHETAMCDLSEAIRKAKGES